MRGKKSVNKKRSKNNRQLKNITKKERYNWNDLDSPGTIRMVPLDQLHIDNTYQRGPVSNSKILAMAANFSLDAAGVLEVAERSNGKLYIVDGQQRFMAAKRRGDVKQIKCYIFQSRGPKHEAEQFLLTNTHRTPVGSHDKYKAAVKYGREPEKSIDRWLQENDLCMTKSNSGKRGIGFPAVLVAMWKKDVGAAKRAALFLNRISNGDKLDNNVFKGLWWLVHNGVPVEQHEKKIMVSGGLVAVQHAIKAMIIQTGKVGERTSGLALLNMINKGKRGRKVVIRPE